MKFTTEHLKDSLKLSNNVSSELKSDFYDEWDEEQIKNQLSVPTNWTENSLKEIITSDSIIKWDSNGIGLISVDQGNAFLSCEQVKSLDLQSKDPYPAIVKTFNFVEEND